MTLYRDTLKSIQPEFFSRINDLADRHGMVELLRVNAAFSPIRPAIDNRAVDEPPSLEIGHAQEPAMAPEANRAKTRVAGEIHRNTGARDCARLLPN